MYKTEIKTKNRKSKETLSTKKNKVLVGKVLGHKKGFGFLDVEGEKEALYLPHTLMKRLFHGDVVKVSVTQGPNGKDMIKVLEILEKEFKEMVGRITIEDGSVFITPDHHRFIHKYFIPKYASRHAQDGEYVVFKRIESDGDTKIKLRVNYVIGSPDTAGFEHRYALISNGLFKFAGMGLESEEDKDLDLPFGYVDFRHIPFITIDSEYSHDLDDAIYAEKTSSGYKLFVAISDVSAHMKDGSPIDDNAKWLGQTIYMPGMSVSMLPDHISNSLCSLKEGEDKLALIMEADVDSSGQLVNYDFKMGAICSAAKISYALVNDYIENKESGANNKTGRIFEDKIDKVLGALLDIGKNNEIKLENIGEEDFDYQIVIDYSSKKAIDIKHVKMLSAQKMVESIMVMMNKCAADYFEKNNINGVYRSHGGLNNEYREEADWFLQMLFQKNADDLNSFENYKFFSEKIKEQALAEHYRSVLNSFINKTKYTLSPQPHYSLGFKSYLTITSPIRKYSDLMNLRSIKSYLLGSPIKEISEEDLIDVNAATDRVRETSRFAEKLFRIQYSEDLLKNKNSENIYDAKICKVDRNGFYVKTVAHGIVGYIYKGQLKEGHEMYVYDQALGWAESIADKYFIGKQLKVSIKSVNRQSQSIEMELCHG